MPVTYKYTLDKSPKKFHCPGCGKKTFVIYRDHEGNFVDGGFGRCDREVKCGYFVKPGDDVVITERKPYQPEPPSLTDVDDVEATMNGREQSNLFRFLSGRFGESETIRAFRDYAIGVDQTGPGTRDWTVYWQIDRELKVRGGKMIRYNADGHRDKAHSATWHHACNRDRYPDYNLVQCFFGEHQLATNVNKRVAVVESEKTALVASICIPEYVWLSCGGKGGLNRGKCAVLKYRHVTLFPDLDAFDEWKLKASEYGFNVSRMLEDIATDEQREQGLDLADFLI